MIKVSVVVPVKNCARYMDLCLDSIQNQTLKDIEIICVDAHSNDGSREIIRAHQEKDNRIKLIDDDKGSGGYAYNLGFKTAVGKYIGMVEADDYIKPEMMEVLYALAEGNNLDYIKADFSIFIEKNKKRIVANHVDSLKNIKEILGKVIDARDYPELLWLDGFLWKGIYRRSFIVDNNLWLNETKGVAYQDNGFLHRTIMRGRRVMYIPYCFYQYRRDNESSSAYDCRGLQLMAREYEFIENDRKANPDIFKPFLPVYYEKMFRLLTGAWRMIDLPDAWEKINESIDMYCDWLKDAYINGRLEGMENVDYSNVLRFLIHPKTFIESDYFGEQKRYKALTEYLDDIEERLESRNPDGVVIVSSGDRGTAQYMLLAKNLETTDIYICDNSKCQQGKEFGYHKVESVEEAVKNHPKGYYVITNEFHHRELKEQIMELGIEEEDIIEFDIPNWIHFASMWTRR